MRFEPLGSKILIEQKEKVNHRTTEGIEIIQNANSEGIVIVASEEYSKHFIPGDVVLYSSGAGYGEYYKGKQCMWIDGRAVNDGGDVWTKIIYDEKNIEDKGDEL